jgi:hypothetical protein
MSNKKKFKDVYGFTGILIVTFCPRDFSKLKILIVILAGGFTF